MIRKDSIKRCVFALGAVAMLAGALVTGGVITTAGDAEALAGYKVSYTGGAGVNVRSGPSASSTKVGFLNEGTALDLRCFSRGDRVNNIDVWYALNSPVAGGFVAAAFVNTPSDPVSGVPACGTNAPPAPSTGAPASGAYATDTASLRPCVNTGNAACNPIGTVARNSSVTMNCWQDGSVATGAYQSQRWFLVTVPGGREAFVHSSLVGRQSNVGRCTDQMRNRAADWALAQVGQRTASSADAARYPDWAPGPYGEWSGDCIKLANAAWVNAGGNTYRGDAIQVYRQYRDQGRIHLDTNPPRGALVFWNVTSAGHVAVAVGGDRVVGTRGVDNQNLPVELYTIASYSNYLGWAMP